MKRGLLFLLCLLAMASADGARQRVFASSPPPPSSSQPDRLARLLTQAPSSPLFPTGAAADPDTAPSLLERPPHVQDLHFSLSGLDVRGVTQFPDVELQRFWQGDLGRTIPLGRLYEIAEALTRFYWSRGYILARVSVPTQTIEDGKAYLDVEEGRINAVLYEGVSTPVMDYVLRHIRKSTVFNIRVLETQLLQLNELSGVSFRSVLSPAPGQSVNITLLGETGPSLRGTISFDNHGSRYIGPYLTTLSTVLEDFPAPFHRTTLTLAGAAQPEELGLVQLRHTFALGRPDLRFSLQADFVRGEPGYRLAASDLTSNTQQFSAGLDWNGLQRRDISLTLHGGVCVYNGNVDVSGAPLSADKIRMIELGLRSEWTSGSGATHQFEFSLTQGLGSVWGGTPNGSSKRSRADSRSDFTALRATLSRLTPFRGLSLLISLSGQLARSGLPASQEFGYGGAGVGRAYDPSEIAGDSGLSALVELRTPAFDLGRSLALQPFLYTDYGAIWNHGDNQTGLTRAASAGFGARLETPSGVVAELLFAQPLRRSLQSTYPNRGGPRVLFSLSTRF